jgi:hypothetical protein
MRRLEDIQVATPCSASWDAMRGNARSRFCRDCGLRVYDLSGMSRPEAEDLVRRTEGRLCVSFYRRQDGTILTKDCPIGLRAMAGHSLGLILGAAGALAAIFVGSLLVSEEYPRSGSALRAGRISVFGALMEWIDLRPRRTTGVVCRPLPPPPAATGIKTPASRESHE